MNDQSARLLGVTFSNGQPAGLDELAAAKKYCGFVGRARRGSGFCVRAENISCPLARFTWVLTTQPGPVWPAL